MASGKRKKAADESSVLRGVVIAAAVVALVAAALSFRDARDRVDSGVAAAAESDAALSLVITQPVDPVVFVDSSVWVLSSPEIDFVSDDGRPVLRAETLEGGVLVASESAAGIVGLAMIPPGVPVSADELLISPLSTAQALVGLHPDVSSADGQTVVAALQRATESAGFAELVSLVDGRSLTSWTAEDRRVLREVVADVRSVEPSGACPGAVGIGGALSECPESSEVMNASHRSMVLARADGVPCELIRGATGMVDPADLDRFGSTLTTNDVGMVGPGQTQVTLASVSCGEAPTNIVAPDQILLANQAVTFSDVSTPFARFLGATAPSTTSRRFDTPFGGLVSGVELAPSGAPTVSEQVSAGLSFVASPSAWPALGLVPLTEETRQRVGQLAIVLAEVYS